MLVNVDSTESGTDSGVLGILERQLLSLEARFRLPGQLVAAGPADAIRAVSIAPANLDFVMHFGLPLSHHDLPETNEGHGSYDRADSVAAVGAGSKRRSAERQQQQASHAPVRIVPGAHGTAPEEGGMSETFDQAELETFITGFRSVARMLMGLAQPVPPPITTASQGRHLWLVR